MNIESNLSSTVISYIRRLPIYLTIICEVLVNYGRENCASFEIVGDVIALHDFTTRRILLAKQFDVVKMVATGGHLDPRIVPNSDLVSRFSRFRIPV